MSNARTPATCAHHRMCCVASHLAGATETQGPPPAAPDHHHLYAADADAEAVVAGLQARGYCIVHGMLSSSEARAKQAELTAVLDRTNTPGGRNKFEGFSTRRLYALFGKTRCFDGPALHPLVLGVVRQMLGYHLQLNSVVGIDIAPGERAQILHRDDAKYPPHALPGFPEVIVNTMWALTDFTPENGATVVLPGTHKGGVAAGSTKTSPPAPVAAAMPAGSVMFYLGSVLHGGGANCTDARRFGVILEYCQGWLRTQETHLLAVPRSVARALPQELQELLGYGVHPPFIGYVDGRHPRRVLEPGGWHSNCGEGEEDEPAQQS